LRIGVLLAVAFGVAACTTPLDGHVTLASFGDQNTDLFIADADGRNAKPLLSHPALDYNGSFSVDGAWVVFTSERGGSADIWRARADGSELTRLTDDPAFDDQAALSPDGHKLAFVSSRSGHADIWLYELGTRTLRNLTNSATGDFRPAWSPDGEWIAFSSDRDSTQPRPSFSTSHSTEIYLMRADGSSVRRLTNRNGIVGSPSWSADGKTIAVYEAGLDEYRNLVSPLRVGGTSQIATVDAVSGAFRVLTSGPGEKWSPRFLPDGRIAYATGGTQPGLAIVGGSTHPIGAARAPAWSPSGKLVFHREMHPEWDPPHTGFASIDKRYRLTRSGVFASYSPDGRQFVVNDGTAGIVHNSILKANADGSGRAILFTDKDKSALAPAWSPKGGRIAFALGRFFPGLPGQPSTSTARIATIDTSGQNLQLLTPDGENAGFPSWSPDESAIVYRVASQGRSVLRVVDVTTRRTRDLTTGAVNDNSPAWSPKGDLIAFTAKRGADKDYDIYVIRPDGSGVTRLTHGPGNQSHPSWSRDGEWIAFTSASGGFKDEATLHPFNPQPYGEIHVMRADGSDRRVLTDNQFEDGTPAWIPGNQLPARQ
jgi:TolB protein